MTVEMAGALARLDDLVARARRAGADAADALLVDSTALSASWRMGRNEGVERSESVDIGLRVLVGRRQAVVSTTDVTWGALDQLVEQALAMARVVPEDPYVGLAPPERQAREIPDLDLADGAAPDATRLLALAEEAEDAGRAVPGVTNSEGGEAGWRRARVALVDSQGFAGSYRATSFSLVASMIAGSGTQMERDYDYATARHAADLDPPAKIGRQAGERARRRLGARKIKSATMAVVFDPRVAGGFLRLLASGLSGTAVARGTSFLKDRMGEAIFASGVTVVDDPLQSRGLASHPFDGEGVAVARRAMVDDGVLKSWFLDCRSARQLGLETAGHAARGTGSAPAPAPSNLYMEAGALAPDALIAETGTGLYVTEMMGMSFNPVTGDYSRGAAGFAIEGGRLGHPVSEVTVAGNLHDMFRSLVPANDLVFRYAMNTPTLRIDGVAVAGL